MRIKRLLPLFLFSLCVPAFGQLQLRDDVVTPTLVNFQPLPAEDKKFDKQIELLVHETKLDEMTPADQNPDEEDEWSSVIVVDLSGDEPRVAGWKQDNFIYPASSYKLYVLGETIRQVIEGEHDLNQRVLVEEHNVRGGSKLAANEEPTLSEVLRLMMTYSDNTAANVAIDVADRQRASALLRAMNLEGSDITRKYLSRSLEDEGYADVPGTVSSAEHFATFIYATETGAIGGGKGRGLIKSYMSMIETAEDRVRAGLPESATLYSKSGTWNIFTSQVSLVEDGSVKYIICVLTPYESEIANPRIADFTKRVHQLLIKTAEGNNPDSE